MSSTKEVWIPAAELANMESGDLVWRVNLPPYAPAENIGVNVHRLGRLARLGGFESLRIGSYAGETTEVTPGIDSVAQDGSATATRSAAITKAKTQQSSVDPTQSVYKNYDEYIWTRGQVLLNTSEIDTRVGEKGANLRDAKAWSKELDSALGKGIRGAVSKNLIERPSISSLFGYLGYGIGSTAVNLLMGGTHDIASWEIQAMASYHVFWRSYLARSFYHLPFRSRRLSLFPVIQFDRVLGAQGISRMPLVKSLENKA